MWTDKLLGFFRVKVSGDNKEETEEEKKARLLKEKNKGGEQADPPENKDGEEDEEELDFESLPEPAKKQIKKLRDENAKRRTAHNNLTTEMEKIKKGLKSIFGEGEEEQDPEVQLGALQGNFEKVSTRNAILELAVQNGISGVDNVEYFEFLMGKQLDSLEEGEELTEEQLEAVLSKCQAKAEGTKEKAKTSPTDKLGGKKPDEKDGQITQEEFNKMGMLQKSKLYGTNPSLYEKLMAGSTLKR